MLLFAQLHAIKHGLYLAWDKGYWRVWCESDSLHAFRLIHATHDIKYKGDVYNAPVIDLDTDAPGGDDHSDINIYIMTVWIVCGNFLVGILTESAYVVCR